MNKIFIFVAFSAVHHRVNYSHGSGNLEQKFEGKRKGKGGKRDSSCGGKQNKCVAPVPLEHKEEETDLICMVTHRHPQPSSPIFPVSPYLLVILVFWWFPFICQMLPHNSSKETLLLIYQRIACYHRCPCRARFPLQWGRISFQWKRRKELD